MPKNGLNVSLNSYDDIFSTEEARQEEQREQVQQISIEELHPFKDHPFKVLDDEAMQHTVESIKLLGVTNPLIARPRPEGGYEIISGHRRQHAAQLAGLKALPVIVRQMDDDAAVLLMVDSNLQREQILPSERAFAYKMKLDALKRQGARSDLTSTQVAQKLSVQQVGDDAGVFLYNYIVDVKFNGLSIGKKIVGVRSVVPENRRKLYNRVHGILRYLFFAIGPITLIYYLITKRVPYDRWFDTKIQKRKVEYDI